VPAIAFDDFKRAKRFPALDGIRAIAVMLVLTVHAGGHGDFRLWDVIDGQMGVTIFFVLSGFLITTLLVREQEARGRVNLKAFYVRRIMRLAPLYYLVIAAYVVLIFASHLPEATQRRADMLRKLPLFVTYMSEYAAAGKYPVFGQAWSLGIEEKFYLAWPSLAFLLLARHRFRVTAAVALSVVLSLAALTDVSRLLFPECYASLFIGCALALILNERAGFERLKFLGNRSVQTVCVVAAVVAQLTLRFDFNRTAALYAVGTAVVIASMVIGERSVWTAFLGSKLMTYIGQRSYAIYLIHVLVTHVVDKIRFLAPHTTAAALGAYAATLGLSLAIAELLYRVVEGPCIRLGHAWSAALQDAAPRPRRRRAELPVRGPVPAPVGPQPAADADIQPSARL